MTGKLFLLLFAYISLGINNQNFFFFLQRICSQVWGEPDSPLLRQVRGPAAPVQWREPRGLLHQGGHQWPSQWQGRSQHLKYEWFWSFISVDCLSRGGRLVLELHLVPLPPRLQWDPDWRQLPRVLLSLASDQDIQGWDLCDGGQRLGRG